MKINGLIIAMFVLISSCVRNEKDFDASGSFEATEIIVSAETMGQVVEQKAHEGDQISKGQVVMVIDSTQLFLKRSQIKASISAIEARRPDIQKQVSALNEQISTAKREKVRISKLVEADAINTKQLDDVNAQISVLQKQKDALESTLKATDQSLLHELTALKAQVSQVEDQLYKCKITSPVDGIVLNKYTELGELATPGKALFKVANTKDMRLKAYITSSQLNSVKLGQKVKVFIDGSDEKMNAYQGIVSKIATQAEFTPKTIQTKDERANQVYAIQIDVQNDGYLKIGMYGEVKF